MVNSRMWYHDHSPENIQIYHIEGIVDVIDTCLRRIYIGETYVCLVHICIYLFAGCFDLCAEAFY